MADWNSKQYLMFRNERTQPAIDLANRILHENPKTIIDIGCGPGNSTNILAQKFPSAYVLGVDNSPNMIEAAKKDYPNLDFVTCDVSKELSMINNHFDIIFSNACIQWVPDHKQLLNELMSLLNPGGMLAVQTPMNYQEPIHKIIAELTISEKWKKEFAFPRIFYNLLPSEYFDLFSEIASDFDLWETTYYHKLNSHKDIMEWYRSTGLKPYLSVLTDEQKKDFEQDVFERVVKMYPIQKDGRIIFRFPRFFFTAVP